MAGEKMEFDKDAEIGGVKGAYKFTVPEEFINGLVIFSNGKGLQYPSGTNVDGLPIGDKMVFHTKGNGWSDNETISYPWSGTLPLVRITTPGGKVIGLGDEGAVKKSRFMIDALGLDGVAAVDTLAAGNVTIKGRGKSAWATDIEKKPYKAQIREQGSCARYAAEQALGADALRRRCRLRPAHQLCRSRAVTSHRIGMDSVDETGGGCAQRRLYRTLFHSRECACGS